MFVVGGTKALDARARCTLWFTWFRPSERNTLRPRRESCIDVCVTLFKAELNLPRVEFFQLSRTDVYPSLL
jgi:hypothetical protein